MGLQIDYYLTAVSPFAYLGHDAFFAVAARHDATVNIKPFNLAEVWGNSGAVMPGERPLVRQRYRMLELQRVAAFRGLDINKKPAHFPTNPTLADHCLCASIQLGGNTAALARAFGEALWERELQVADEAVARDILVATGHDADAALSIAGSDAAADMRARNTSEAIAADAVGAPAYVFNDEVFWGQDRIEYLDEMIGSGRNAFSAEV